MPRCSRSRPHSELLPPGCVCSGSAAPALARRLGSWAAAAPPQPGPLALPPRPGVCGSREQGSGLGPFSAHHRLWGDGRTSLLLMALVLDSA